jgi:acyl-CoA dehydrogenase
MIRDQSSLDQLLETLRRFIAERLVPNETRVSEEDRVPPELVAEMRALGLFGLSIPEEFGGVGLTKEEEVMAAFEIGSTSP